MKQTRFNNKLTITLTTLILLFSLETSKADLIFLIDLDPSVSGIQNTRQVTTNTPFQASLYLELTGSTSLDSYRTSITFDNPGLTLTSGTPTPLPNYSRQSGLPTLSAGNVFGPFEAASNVFGGGLTAPQGPRLIGNLVFTTQSTPGTYTIQPIETILDGSFDNDFNQLTPTFLGGSIGVSAVPEPSSIALVLCIASMGMAKRFLRGAAGRNMSSTKPQRVV